MDDPEALMDVLAAAQWATEVRRQLFGPTANVSVYTIWQWISRGHLKVAGRTGRKSYVTQLAVAQAEAATRDRARRVVPTAA